MLSRIYVTVHKIIEDQSNSNFFFKLSSLNQCEIYQ